LNGSHSEVPIMRETTTLGPWIRRFLLEHLISERNLAANTRRSYRDTLCQLLPFVSARLHKAVDRLAVVDVSSKLVREFLGDVETSRGCGIATRNQRLAAIHALARFIGEHSPEHIAWSAQVRCVPYKKGTHATVPYLDKVEIDALLACPNRCTQQGRREYALLLFLYNTGARASEASELTIRDLHLDHASVDILGKGRKRRQCPLWPTTVRRAARTRRRPVAARARLPQSLWATDDALRCSRVGGTHCSEGPEHHANPRGQEGQSAQHSALDSDTSAELRCRDQYRAGLARSRLARDHQRVRRNQPGGEGARPRQVRGHYRPSADQAVARRRRRDAVPAIALGENLMWRSATDLQRELPLGATYGPTPH
jgi:site-specific recombinase XerD